MRRSVLRTFLCVLLFATALAAAAPPRAIWFHQVRVFDGRSVLPVADVLVVDGRIAAVGPEVQAPGDAVKIDGKGKTLLPGLIDAHTHVFPGALQQALAFGVTTELDMTSDPKFDAAMRDEQLHDQGQDRADLRSAGILVTAPKGHGTEYGVEIPTLGGPAEAQAFVDARIAEGSDYIKIVYDDGSTYGLKTPTLSPETLKAVIVAAHKREKLAVVHIGSLAQAREAIADGADGLAHLFVDRAPDPDFGRFVAEHHAFVVPTLTVLETVAVAPSGAGLAKDARLSPYVPAIFAANLTRGFNFKGGPPMSYPAAEASVQQLKAAKVPILAGTDAPNPGTAHGISMHRELELLVKAGLTPTEALAAATSAPAKAFGLADRGRISQGLRADLLLVSGDPTKDILATRDIAGIWKQGVPFDRTAYKASLDASRTAAAQPPKGQELTFPFESFKTDGHDLAGIALVVLSPPGPFSFAIDDFGFR